MKTIFIFFLVLMPTFGNAEPAVKTSGGRFQLIQLSSMRRDQFLLDTHTGKMWSKSCFVRATDPSDCEMAAWMLESVEGITGSRDAIFKQAIAIEKMKKEKGEAESK